MGKLRKYLAVWWYCSLWGVILISVLGGVFADAGLRAPLVALATAAIALSRRMNWGEQYLQPRFFDCSIGLGTVATAYLWLVSETGDTWVVPALSGDLLLMLALTVVMGIAVATTHWAHSLDERRIRERERGGPRSRALDKEQWLYWAVAPVAIGMGLGFYILVSWVAANRLD